MSVDPLLLDIPERLDGERTVLLAPRAGLGAEMAVVITQSLAHLRPWMPWAQDAPSAESAELVVRRMQADFIARRDLCFQIYARRPDGKLDNIFTFRRSGFDSPEVSWHGTAWVTNTDTNAEWKVRFIWPFSSTYLVLELDPDYRWAVIGHPSRNYLWILARQPELSADIRNRLVGQARGLGFPVDDLILVDHAKPDCASGQPPAKWRART